MRWMVYFKLARQPLVPCWRLFESNDEALAYASSLAKTYPEFEYRIFRKL